MPKALLLAFSVPTEGDEEEFNRWYSDQHLPDTLKVPGVVSAQRFELETKKEDLSAFPWKYLAVYEIDHEDPLSLYAELRRRDGTPEMPRSPTIDGRFTKVMFAHPITSRQES